MIEGFGGGKANSSSHEKFIKLEYPTKIHWDQDVESFIGAVFDFGWKDIHPTPYVGELTQGRNGGDYYFDGDDVKKYQTVTERKGYPPLKRLMNGLLRQLYGPVGGGSRGTRLSKIDRPAASKRRKEVKDYRTKKAGKERPTRDYPGSFIIRDCEAKSLFQLREKPDCTYGVTATENPAWEWEGLAVEIGRSPCKVNTGGKSLQDILISGRDGEAQGEDARQ
ncbi:hypothetical protein DAEQUDRAFT_770096 [Daedalea quercina L-15889]|uniref:Uncharacterized protein n=1 Tax=Daedalea quercina L-15889 TaxID=1314783 RepID=A0A165L6M6_9APHY|nr:hypothetical protein DAEQUDRAFT_770096 [Daedalea quercina L-15889]